MYRNNQIKIEDLSLKLPHKTCFEEFTTNVQYGEKIAIIGRNGSGKTSLLKMLAGNMNSDGVVNTDGLRVAYIPQIINCYDSVSGAQAFNKALSSQLANNPDVLLLDEPTNHLDSHNKASLLKMLSRYHGTLLIVTHDIDILRSVVDVLWHIEDGAIKIFYGKYDDYMYEVSSRRGAIEKELSMLNREKKDAHKSLMQEQLRSKKSKAKGYKSISQRKWPTVVSNAKATRAQETSGRKQNAIKEKRNNIVEKLEGLPVVDVVTPKFSLDSARIGSGIILQISDGGVSYGSNSIVEDINISVSADERIAILGNNGSGKTTLVRAILSDHNVTKSGDWLIPKDIGYLDQKYEILDSQVTVIESMESVVPEWTHSEIRRHLNDFLFRKNEEISELISDLSGGEKARLCLAHIAAKTPKMLVLDEITNNLDIETKEHVVQVLRNYPGAIIVISHDEDFLASINIDAYYEIQSCKLIRR